MDHNLWCPSGDPYKGVFGSTWRIIYILNVTFTFSVAFSISFGLTCKCFHASPNTSSIFEIQTFVPKFEKSKKFKLEKYFSAKGSKEDSREVFILDTL